MLSGYTTIFAGCLKSFEHLQPLCCPSHPRLLNNLMHLQIPSFRSRCSLGQINHTNQCVVKWPQNPDMMLLSGYATILRDVSILFEHLQPLCCPSHPRFLNNLMHLQNPFPLFCVPLGQIKHTTGALRHSIASTYMLELLL